VGEGRQTKGNKGGKEVGGGGGRGVMRNLIGRHTYLVKPPSLIPSHALISIMVNSCLVRYHNPTVLGLLWFDGSNQAKERHISCVPLHGS